MAEVAAELGDFSGIHEISDFQAKILKLGCQNGIGMSCATALTLHRQLFAQFPGLLKAEDHIAANDPDNLRIDWTDVPGPSVNSKTCQTSHPLPA